MIHLPITAAERTTMLQTLRGERGIIHMRTQITILDRREKPISQLTVPAGNMESGTVTVDAQADITRSLAMTFVDPKRRLGFDAASPAKGALYADNMIRVERGVKVPGIGWIDIPVFWGPVTNFERDSSEVTIEAQGKESLALDPHFATNGYMLKKGRRIDDAIRDVMDRMGETRYNMPDLPGRLANHRAVEADDEPWDVVKFGWSSQKKVFHGKGKNRRGSKVDVEYGGLVKHAGHFYAFYDGHGRLTVRRRSGTALFTFKEGRDLLSVPKVGFDVLNGRNHVVVTGGKITRGKKKIQLRGHATLHPGHPLSPYNIGRNGKARYMTEFVTQDGLKTQAAVNNVAQDVLASKSNGSLDLSFDALPMPFLEELDYVAVQTNDYTMRIPLRSFTIPLTSDEPMTVGYTKGGA